MPNGGSDCCGTCWFNSKNDGESGHHDSEKEGAVVCTIRNIEIDDPFWTYCANHPHHNRDKVDLPLGPVYVSDGSYPYSRKVWMQAPDNESIRIKLLEILDRIDSAPSEKYPSPIDIEEEVIKQITALKETRSLPILMRITRLVLSDYEQPISPIYRNIPVIVGQAIEALLEISKGHYLDTVKHFINIGISENYDQEKDNFAAIRYHLIRGLQFCPQDEGNELLKIGFEDPHPEVKAFAYEIFKKKQRI